MMNLKIKFRESFRPFAPAVLRERAHDYFELRPDEDSPYMLLVGAGPAGRAGSRRRRDAALARLDKLNSRARTIPAVTHVDYSARVQTVDAAAQPALLQASSRRSSERTGCPVLVNTSFNVRGEPIVNTPADAYRCFMSTDMDVLVMENCVLFRDQQPQAAGVDRDAYLKAFALD